MKQWQIEGGFGFDNLRCVEVETPKPTGDRVLVRLTAASVNFRDTLVLNGHYGGEQPLPLVPLSDAAGIVEEVGPQATQFRPGDRVTGCFFQNWQGGEGTRQRLDEALGAGRTPGVAGEFRLFSERGLVATPDYLTDLEAATLPCAAVTAWSALAADCRAAPGETVLIQGTGGVSVFALQMAHAMGLRTIVTSSSEDKLDRVRALGADAVINYTEIPEWGAEAQRLTEGYGVDHVIEVGGAGTLAQSIEALRIGGRIAVIGVLSGSKAEIAVPYLLMKRVRLTGITVGSRDAHEAMNRFLSLHRLTPVIDEKRLGFEDLPEAFRHMMSRRHFGKICIAIPGDVGH